MATETVESAKAATASNSQTSDKGGISDELLEQLMLKAKFRPTSHPGQVQVEIAEACKSLGEPHGQLTDPTPFGSIAEGGRFEVLNRTIGGVTYVVLNFHAVRQENSGHSKTLRSDQCRALTRILIKMWGIQAYGIRNLVRTVKNHWGHDILMPVTEVDDGRLSEIRSANLRYLLSTAWLLRKLRGNDLVAYGAEPWVPNWYDLQEHRQAMIEAAAKRGDVKAKIKLLQQEYKTLKQDQRYAAEDRRNSEASVRQCRRRELALAKDEMKLKAKISQLQRRLG
jgi:hypothetical protein